MDEKYLDLRLIATAIEEEARAKSWHALTSPPSLPLTQ
jgi:hypothetical protein